VAIIDLLSCSQIKKCFTFPNNRIPEPFLYEENSRPYRLLQARQNCPRRSHGDRQKIRSRTHSPSRSGSGSVYLLTRNRRNRSCEHGRRPVHNEAYRTFEETTRKAKR